MCALNYSWPNLHKQLTTFLPNLSERDNDCCYFAAR